METIEEVKEKQERKPRNHFKKCAKYYVRDWIGIMSFQNLFILKHISHTSNNIDRHNFNDMHKDSNTCIKRMWLNGKSSYLAIRIS